MVKSLREAFKPKILYLRLTATAPIAFAASFWMCWEFRTGFAALRAPAVALDTALNIMADCRGVGTVTKSEEDPGLKSRDY